MLDKPPDFLYHYTSSEGFSGIIKDKKMWATAIGYLNDSTEFAYAFAVIIEALRMLRKKHPDDDEPFLEELEKQLNGLSVQSEIRDEVFVCSFSGLEDRLSQWRGYCSNGNGYSICFDGQKLKSVASLCGALFDRCLYDKDEQLQKIQEALKLFHSILEDEIRAAPSKNQDTPTSVQRAARISTLLFMQQTAPFLKHPSFREEEEWRMSLIPAMHGSPGYLLSRSRHFRMGKSHVIIPYVEISLIGHQATDGPLPFRRIYVGPTADENTAKKSAEEFLRMHDMNNCDVVNSGIPYRPL